MTNIRELLARAACAGANQVWQGGPSAGEYLARLFYVGQADAIRSILNANGLVIVPREPSKARLIGEFKFHREMFDEDGESYSQEYIVPWTTIKEIIAAHLAASPYWEGE